MCRHQYFRCADLVRCPQLGTTCFRPRQPYGLLWSMQRGSVPFRDYSFDWECNTKETGGGGVVHSLTPTLPLSMRLIRESIRECCHSVHITTAAGIEQRKKPTRVFALCCCEGQQELLQNSFQFVCFLRASVKTMGSKTGGHGLCCCLLSLSPVVLLFLPSTSCVVVDVELCLV